MERVKIQMDKVIKSVKYIRKEGNTRRLVPPEKVTEDRRNRTVVNRNQAVPQIVSR